MNRLTEEFISFEKRPEKWEEAIQIAAQSLLENKYIEQSYIDKMIDNVNKFGTYIVIAPHIALPHSRPEDGVNKGGYSVTIFEDDVKFSDNQAKVFITLASSHNEQHLELIAKVATNLDTQEKIDLLLNTKDKETIIKLFEGELNG